MDYLIYPPFYSKSKSLTIVKDFYQDKDFAAYYNTVTSLNEFNLSQNNDYNYYTSNISKDSKILEIGSGNGRIFNQLFEENYNVYGLEPSLNMSTYINSKAKNRIFHMTLQDFTRNSKLLDPNVVIIPATSISLFNTTDFENFLRTLLKKSSFSTIIFDFLKPQYFLQSNRKITTINLDNNTYYYVNFLFDNSIIFNIISTKHKKLGISQKFIYSSDYFERLFKKLNGKLEILKEDTYYSMIKGVFNEK